MEKLQNVALIIAAVATGLVAIVAWLLNLYLLVCIVPTLGTYYYSQKILKQSDKQSKLSLTLIPFLPMGIVAAFTVTIINLFDDNFDNLLLFDNWSIVLPVLWIIVSWFCWETLKNKILDIRMIVTLMILVAINTIYFIHFGLFMLYF